MQPVAWTRPWYNHLAAAGRLAEQHLAAGMPPWEALNRAGSAPVHFVPPEARAAGTAYEQFVWQTRQCPTRPGVHDFFNALCWIGFPATKSALNRLHAATIAAQGRGPQRGALRDALTHFDENAALLQAPDPLWAALAARQWHTAFVELRALWSDAQLLPFGHGLLEKLMLPHKGITAHVYRVLEPCRLMAEADAWVAASLGDGEPLAGKPFVPLQVLGVPGWWPENTDTAFYADTRVFRPARGKSPPRQ